MTRNLIESLADTFDIGAKKLLIVQLIWLLALLFIGIVLYSILGFRADPLTALVLAVLPLAAYLSVLSGDWMVFSIDNRYE